MPCNGAIGVSCQSLRPGQSRHDCLNKKWALQRDNGMWKLRTKVVQMPGLAIFGSCSSDGDRVRCTQVDQEVEEELEEEGEKKHAKGGKQKGGDAGRGNEAVPGTGSGNLTESESRAEGNADTITGSAMFFIFHAEQQGGGQPRSYGKLGRTVKEVIGWENL